MTREKYLIAFVGFKDIEKATAALNIVMEKEGIWLFTIVGGKEGIGRNVAEKVGAPYQFCKSLKQLEYQSNYVIVDLSAGQEVKNWMMRMKSAGKHGYAVR